MQKEHKETLIDENQNDGVVDITADEKVEVITDTKEVIENYLNDEKVKANLIQLALNLHTASNGKWVNIPELHKKSEYRGDLKEFKFMLDLLVLSKLAFTKQVENSQVLKIKITLNKDARKATLIQQISQLKQTLAAFEDELAFIAENELAEKVQ